MKCLLCGSKSLTLQVEFIHVHRDNECHKKKKEKKKEKGMCISTQLDTNYVLVSFLLYVQMCIVSSADNSTVINTVYWVSRVVSRALQGRLPFVFHKYQNVTVASLSKLHVQLLPANVRHVGHSGLNPSLPPAALLTRQPKRKHTSTQN